MSARVDVIVLRLVAIGLWWQRKQWAITGAICEYTVIPGQILEWGGQQDGETFEELCRLHDELSDTGGRGPGTGELIAHLAAREDGDSLRRERRSQPIATEPFEPFAVVGLHGAGGVQRESTSGGAKVLFRRCVVWLVEPSER